MIFALLAIVILVLIFGVSKKNVIAGGGSLLGAFLIGGIGIAALGTAIAFPPFAVVIVLFFIFKGLFSK